MNIKPFTVTILLRIIYSIFFGISTSVRYTILSILNLIDFGINWDLLNVTIKKYLKFGFNFFSVHFLKIGKSISLIVTLLLFPF